MDVIKYQVEIRPVDMAICTCASNAVELALERATGVDWFVLACTSARSGYETISLPPAVKDWSEEFQSGKWNVNQTFHFQMVIPKKMVTKTEQNGSPKNSPQNQKETPSLIKWELTDTFRHI